MELTQSEENYIKAVFSLSNGNRRSVNTNELAKYVQTKASSVTDMLRKLSEKDLLIYEKYQGVTLTDLGKKLAVGIIRKHRLWEVFLVEKLNFGWDEVHDVAEQLEHIRSPKLTNRLDDFLGNPQFDPHGDPIPDAKGNFPAYERMLLSEFKAGDKLIVTGVKDGSPEFLQYLREQTISLGSEIEIEQLIPHDQSMHILIDGKKRIMLSNISCHNIYGQYNK